MMESFTLYVLFNKHLRYNKRVEKISSKNSYRVKIGIQLLLTYQKQIFDSAGCSQLKVLILNLF